MTRIDVDAGSGTFADARRTHRLRKATVNRHALESAVIMFVRQYLTMLKVDHARIKDDELLKRVERTFKTMPESDVRRKDTA